jgi:hypothetical protein
VATPPSSGCGRLASGPRTRPECTAPVAASPGAPADVAPTVRETGVLPI